MLDIVERQQSPSGAITWVRVGKTPIRVAGGGTIGRFGMYEVLDPGIGQKLFVDRLKQAVWSQPRSSSRAAVCTCS